MHIHKIRFGNCTKLLLRQSVRDGRAVRKLTLANLTPWSKEQLDKLEAALTWKRLCTGTAFESEADRQIFNIVAPNVHPSKLWRLMVPFSGVTSHDELPQVSHDLLPHGPNEKI